nr:ATP synthase subunit I [uncultured Neisseria sp.]
MRQILIWQCAMLAAVAFVGAVCWGERGFWSALAGGASYLIPTVAAVLLLRLLKNRPHLQSRMFMAGEALKVMLSLALMLSFFAVWHQSLVFLPFLFGLFSVSHLVFLVLLRVKDYGR